MNRDFHCLFLVDQGPWGEDRQYRPAILFEFERRDRMDPDYKVEPMMDKGRIVLDPDNHPVRNFREIPVTISSAVEGWLMEAIRRTNSKISAADFRARMLRSPTRDGNGTLITANAVDMRMTRWRQEHRCISWVTRGGSKAFKDHLWGLMTKEMRENNTTRGLEDVQDKGELAKMQLANQGQHLSKAGSRAIPDHVRKRREKKVIEKANRFDELQARTERSETRKRKRAISGHEELNNVLNLQSQPRRRKLNTARGSPQPFFENNTNFSTNFSTSSVHGGNALLANPSMHPAAGASQMALVINNPIYLSAATASEYASSSFQAHDAVSTFQPCGERHSTRSVLDSDTEREAFNI